MKSGYGGKIPISARLATFDCAALKFPSYAFIIIAQIEALWSKYQSVLTERNVIIEQQYTDFEICSS